MMASDRKIVSNRFMKNYSLLFLTAAMATTFATAQEVVKVGKGSYASYTPLEMCYSEYHTPGDYGWKGDKSKYMQYRKLYLTERENQPIPTNDWWTNLITQPYSGRMWSYPQFVQAQKYGIDVQAPSYWLDNGTEMKSNTVVSVKGEDFAPEAAVADNWHDWDVEFYMEDGDKRMYATMAHGMPFTWIETQNMQPQISISRSYQASGSFNATTTEILGADGAAMSGTVTGVSMFALRMDDDVYGVYLPENSDISIEKGMVTVGFNGARQYVVVGVLNTISDMSAMAKYAYSVPRETKVTWQYSAADGRMRTTWTVDAEDLRATAGTPADAANVMQGFLPHQYRNTGYQCTLPFNGTVYGTPHGKLKMAEGASLTVDYRFYGMLPYYAVPNDIDRADNPYDVGKMKEMLESYAKKGTFGADTYWGGKGLTQMALNMMFAREMGEKEIFELCRSKLKDALVNWLTYTPGERNYFFARYDRWGAMVGYNTSYDSDTFNDHHFHYGYFTYAAALLALVDDDFRNNYGEMITLVAKDYANWDRNDTRYPMFRTFDPWAGHSFAGGMGDDNGNGQESSSEAMQGWGGLYLLGVALGNDGMRDAGMFGWLSEARGTAEYWFDRHDDPNTGKDGYHTTDNDEYNIKYSRFLYNDSEDNPKNNGKHLPYNSNLTCHGVGFWTYFGYDAIFMQGIQWMPISPALDYLSEDKAFAAWDFKRMWEDKYIGGWFKSEKTEAGYLGDSGGWGNVALAYLQRSNPDEAAKIFDMCWDANEPEFRTYDTNGITYFITHSHLTYGDIDWSILASIPTARVYVKEGKKTYMAFNPTDEPVDVRFSDGGELKAVPARRLSVSGMTSKDNTDITEDVDVPTDPREEIEMVNLALKKTVTESGHENGGTLPENAVDGDDATRWGSAQVDGSWIAVDLGKDANIYKVKIHWETAYSPTYAVQVSDNGTQWSTAQDVTSDGGWDEIMLADIKARHVRILCGKRQAENWGFSIYELQVFGKFTDAQPSDLLGVKLTADRDVLKQNEPTQISAKGYTCGGDWIDVNAKWSTTDGNITSNGRFTPNIYPRATVKATVGTTVAEKTFPVEEALFAGYIQLSPKDAELPEGETLVYDVTVLNQFEGPMDKELDNIEWTISNENGVDNGGVTIDKSTATLTANEVGTYTIAVKDGIAKDTATVKVLLFTDINLALRKPTTATSQENDGMGADKATDGDAGTRWGSVWGDAYTEDYKDDQCLTVDLQGLYSINRVRVLWQAARAKLYELQVSTDGVEWTTVSRPEDSPEDETIVFDEVTARYVRMQGIKRNMGYGYSIFEFEVFGTQKISGIVDVERLQPATDECVYSINGMIVGKGLHTLKTLKPGIYIKGGKKVKLTAG